MIEKIFKAFYKYCKKQKIKVIYGSEGGHECPYFSLKEMTIHLMTKEENIKNLREMIHEWTHSTYLITNRDVFNSSYPLEELVAEKTAYDIMCKYGFYPDSDFNRESYVWKFKHGCYLDFWLTKSTNTYKNKSVQEILDMVNGHIEAATKIISELIEKEDE